MGKKSVLAKAKSKITIQNLKKPGAIALGFVGGRLVTWGVDKFIIQKLFKDPTTTPAKIAHKLKGLIPGATGFLIAYKSKNEYLKYAGYGATASGAFTIFEDLTGKDVSSSGGLDKMLAPKIINATALPPASSPVNGFGDTSDALQFLTPFSGYGRNYDHEYIVNDDPAVTGVGRISTNVNSIPEDDILLNHEIF